MEEPTIPTNAKEEHDHFFAEIAESIKSKEITPVASDTSESFNNSSSLVKITKDDVYNEDQKNDSPSSGSLICVIPKYNEIKETLSEPTTPTIDAYSTGCAIKCTKDGKTYTGEVTRESPLTIQLNTESFGRYSWYFDNIEQTKEYSTGCAVKCTKDGKTFTGEVTRESPLTIQLNTESFGRYSWYFDNIEQTKDLYTEIDIVLESHHSFPWGLAANLSDPCDQWHVTQVHNGQQMAKKGVQVGWEYVRYNGRPITACNQEEIRYELTQGNPGVITFRKAKEHFMIDITLASHKESPWGIAANVGDHSDEWKVTKVHPNKQADTKGVVVGWKYLKWNHETINDSNVEAVREHLMHGHPGTITFARVLTTNPRVQFTAHSVKQDIFQAAPSSIFVTGSSEPSLNGRYLRWQEHQNGKVCYRSTEYQLFDYFLCWSEQKNQWQFCDKLSSSVSAEDSKEYTNIESTLTTVYGFVKNNSPVPNIITDVWMMNERPNHRLRIRAIEDNRFVTIHFEGQYICDWGLDINFFQPYREWKVTYLTNHLSADEEGVQLGWYLRKHNFIDIQQDNYTEIQRLIQSGEECQVTFEIPGSENSSEQGTRLEPVDHIDANGECAEFQFAEPSVIINGLKFHNDANGEYLKSNRCYFGRVVYSRMSASHIYYLRFHPSGAWVIDDAVFHHSIDTNEAKDNTPSGLAVVCDSARTPWATTDCWVEFESVYGGYVRNSDISVNGSSVNSLNNSELSKDVESDEQKFELAPDALNIQGFSGSDVYNGWYYKGKNPVNERAYYENNDETHHSYLYYDLHTECWVFGSTLDNADHHFAYVHDTARCVTNIKSTGWYYRHDHFGTFVPFPSLTIVSSERYHQQKQSEKQLLKAVARAQKKSDHEKLRERKTQKLRHMSCTGTVVSSEGDCKESIAIQSVPGIRFSSSSVKEFTPLEGLYLPCGKYNAHYYYQLEKKIGFEQEETYVVLFFDGTDTWFLANRLGKESTIFAACLGNVTMDHCRFPVSDSVTWTVIPIVQLDERRNKMKKKLPTTTSNVSQSSRYSSFFMLENGSKSRRQVPSSASCPKLTVDDFISVRDVTISEVQLPSRQHISYVHEEMNEAELKITLQNASPRILITGRRGRNEIINGSYVKLGDVHEGRVCYKKVDDSCVIRWHPVGVWMISVYLYEGLRCFAYCCDASDYPSDIQQPWQIRLNHLFQEDTNIRVKCQTTLENTNLQKRRKVEKMMIDGFPEFPASSNIALPLVLTQKMYSQLNIVQSDTGYTLAQIMQPGIDNPTKVNTGVLAGDADCYVAFAPLFNGLISAVHEGFQVDEQCHLSDFNINQVFDSGLDDEYIIGCSVELSRNIANRKLPCWATVNEKQALQNILVTCLDFEDPSLRGTYASNSSKLISNQIGCGVFTNSGKDCCILVNHNEHITVTINSQRSNLKDIFERAVHAVDNMELILRSLGHEYMTDMNFGYLMSNPMNTGTGMKISVRCDFPLVMCHPEYAHILSNLRLCSTVANNENAQEGVTISNVDRIGYTEIQCLQFVLKGVETLIQLEQLLYKGTDIEPHLPNRKPAAWTNEAKIVDLRARLRRVSSAHSVREHVGPAPKSIVVTGRRGENNVINGLYFKDRDLHNNRPSYSKTSYVTEVHLSWHSSGYWVFDDEITTELKGFAIVKSDAIYPSLIRQQWKVLAEEMFVLEDNLRIRDFDKVQTVEFKDDDILHYKSSKIFRVKHEDAEDKMACPLFRVSLQLSKIPAAVTDDTNEDSGTEDKYPRELFVSGEHGVSELVNGSYILMDEPHAARPCWINSEKTCYLQYHPQECWLFSATLGTRLKGYAVVPSTTDRPHLIERTWRVCIDNDYRKDANLVITDLTALHGQIHE